MTFYISRKGVKRCPAQKEAGKKSALRKSIATLLENKNPPERVTTMPLAYGLWYLELGPVTDRL